MKQQLFNNGKIKIYQVSEVSEPGGMPVEGIYELFAHFNFEERKIGITRRHMAMQDNQKIDRLIRIWQDRYIEVDFICTINDGFNADAQYRIAKVDHFRNDDGLKLTDLTLERLDDFYDIE